MTDGYTAACNDIKDSGKLSSSNHKVVSYSCFLKEEQEREYLTSIESTASCPDKICIECGNNHSFRGNFEDAITLINLLPEIFKSNSSISSGINKLQEFVN
jgi:hypothetical protein